ncbi:MAG TPA: thiamine pyrophosphate-binding protein [Gaiellaceae bacterium]|nr:thiamine pyrophosphate-binding protein [Gaiellaceae bacterium]
METRDAAAMPGAGEGRLGSEFTFAAPTGGELVVDTLRALGVRHVFGIPGGQTLAITDAILDHDDIRFVTTRHEGAAACMADAIGRLTGRVGVCLATTGPGATNLVTGVGGAFRDSSPVLVITCNNRMPDISRDDAQAADHVSIFRPLTKWATLVSDPLTIPRVIHEAAIRATSGCPGPVLVDFARSALEAIVPVEAAVAVGYPAEAGAHVREVPGQRTLAEPALVERAAEVLAAACRPVIWIGNGVQISGASDAVLELAEALQAPVLTTFNALGAVPTSHPNVFGPLSRMGTNLSRRVMDGCDLVLAVGNSLNAVSTSRWQLDLPDTIVQVDADAATIGVNYPTRTFGLTGDARAVTEQLTQAIAATRTNGGAAAARARRLAALAVVKEDWWAEADAVDMSESPMLPAALVKVLRQQTPEDAVLVVDAGNPGVWSHLWHVRRPGQYLKPVGFGNMGFALPAAIAAKLIEPERPVVALVGDGALGMTMGELETVTREQVSICIVVMNDLGYGNIRQEELLHYGERLVGVDFVDADYAAVARGFGIAGYCAERADELADAMREILASGGAGLVDARIDPAVNVWTHPLLAESGT